MYAEAHAVARVERSAGRCTGGEKERLPGTRMGALSRYIAAGLARRRRSKENPMVKKLLVLLAVLALLAAACGDGEEDPLAELEDEEAEEVDEANGIDPEDPDTIPEDAVEIFSWWTGAGEEAGLLALIDMFEQEYPQYEVVNSAVAGGAGVDARAVLTSRMQAGDPPSTFQIHAGRALLDTWVAADAMEPLNFLYDEEGWWDAFPETLIELTSDDEDNIYSVPVNVHRSNVLFSNSEAFEEHGLTPPTTFDEFFEVAEELEAAGVTPLALGDNETWTLLHTWETVLLGTAGPDLYVDLFAGNADWTSPEVVESFEMLDQMFAYINDDHAARNWQDAAELVATGDAAMNIMGDWAAGYFATDLELEPETDFGWNATPNTSGGFIFVIDTFGLPEGATPRDGTIDWLRVLGSREGQEVFNPLKGSIPARLDADTSVLNEYGQSTFEDFQQDTLAPSLAHNSAAPPDFTGEALGALEVWMAQRDADQAVNTLQTAAEDYLR
jgi:glucose/mannose transport system substrate-binding protein